MLKYTFVNFSSVGPTCRIWKGFIINSWPLVQAALYVTLCLIEVNINFAQVIENPHIHKQNLVPDNQNMTESMNDRRRKRRLCAHLKSF